MECDNTNLTELLKLVQAGWLGVNHRIDENEMALLHEACLHGDILIIRQISLMIETLLMDDRIRVNSTNGNGETPLHLACDMGDDSMVYLLLLTKSVDTNMKTYYEHRTPLHCACLKGHVSVVRRLIQDSRVDVNQPDKDGLTPLHYACHKGYDSVVQELVQNNPRVNINQINYQGWTPLHTACLYGNAAIVKLLLDNGADITMRTAATICSNRVDSDHFHSSFFQRFLSKTPLDIAKLKLDPEIPRCLCCEHRDNNIMEYHKIITILSGGNMLYGHLYKYPKEERRNKISSMIADQFSRARLNATIPIKINKQLFHLNEELIDLRCPSLKNNKIKLK